MSPELLFGLGAPLATVLLLTKWVLNHFAPVKAKAASACGCGHDFAFHDLAEGKCGGTDRWRPDSYSSYRERLCGCKQFTGAVR